MQAGIEVIFAVKKADSRLRQDYGAVDQPLAEGLFREGPPYGFKSLGKGQVIGQDIPRTPGGRVGFPIDGGRFTVAGCVGSDIKIG